MSIYLTDKKLKVLWVTKKDSVLFSGTLNQSDTLQQISNINFNAFKKEYSNPCIDDGLGLEVFIEKNGFKKHTSLDNYYKNEIGQILSFVNTYIPVKYKVSYDKNQLVQDYERCKEEMKRTK